MPPAIIAAGIGAAGGIGATALGSHMSGNTAKRIAAQQQQMAQAAQARSKPAYDQAYGYYSKLLSGDPNTFMQGVGPDLTNTQLQFSQASKNLLQNSQARGGGLGVGLGQIEGAKALSISNLLNGVRPMAAGALSALATGDQNAALGALGAAQNSHFQDQYLQQQSLGGIGSFITRLLSSPGLYSMFSKGQQGQGVGPVPGNPMTVPAVIGGNPWYTPGSTPAGNVAFPTNQYGFPLSNRPYLTGQ